MLNHYKSSLEATNSIREQLKQANSKVEELTKKLADGTGDAVLKQQLKDSQTQVAQLQEQLSNKEQEFANEKTKLEKAVRDVHVDYAFDSVAAGIKFKAGIPESVQKTMLMAAKAEVLAKGTPDFIDDGKGGKKLVIRGADGNILNNAKNNLNPYTISELVMETSIKDIIDNGKQQRGGGTHEGGSGGQGGSSILDFSGVKSQVEADKLIEAHLLANGITRDSAQFAEQSMQLRNENNVSQLPIR